MTLTKLIEWQESIEMGEAMDKATGQIKDSINRVQASTSRFERKKTYPQANSQTNSLKCFNCNGSFPHNCPAANHNCKKCNNRGHFEQCCESRKKKIAEIKANRLKGHKLYNRGGNRNGGRSNTYFMDKTTTISDESEETGDEVYHVKLNRVRACETRKNKSPTLGATVCGTYVKHIVDTGSQTNVMSSTTCNSLKQKPKLKVTNARLYPLNSKEPLDTLVEFDASLVINNITKVVKYIVVHRK